MEMFEKLSRNPLGVIGLFIFLVYAISGWVLTKLILNIPPALQWIFVLFIVTYPLVLLWTFYLLVTEHPDKLYAPKDFRSDEAFNRYSSGHFNLAEKIQEYDETVNENARVENQKIEIKQETVLNFLGKERLASELLFRHLENIYGATNVRREPAKSFLSEDYGYDFVVSKGRERIYIDVKLIGEKSPLNRIIDSGKKSADFINQIDMLGSTKERTFMLWGVTDQSMSDTAQTKNRFATLLQQTNTDFPYDFISLKELEEKYLSDIKIKIQDRRSGKI